MLVPRGFTGIFQEADYGAGTRYAVKHPALATKQLCYRRNAGDYGLPSETHYVITNQ